MTDRDATAVQDGTPPAPRAEGGSTVWLRANPRPVWLIAAAQWGGLAIAWLLVAGLVGWPPFGPWSGAAVGAAALAAVLATAVGIIARAALLPRVERRGERLRVRVAPGRTADLPIAALECFFLGSDALAGEPSVSPATHRVGTLVIRCAERDAAACAALVEGAPVGGDGARGTTAWGRWQDGAVVLDGRWCEPLSVDLARRLSGLLVEARRDVLGAPRPAEQAR
ncbi:MAG: hypothetical protein KGQ61_07225 [Planctomycetes bacterium]|nr:hypothetical protein [Planctomycetota bacterium]